MAILISYDFGNGKNGEALDKGTYLIMLDELRGWATGTRAMTSKEITFSDGNGNGLVMYFGNNPHDNLTVFKIQTGRVDGSNHMSAGGKTINLGYNYPDTFENNMTNVLRDIQGVRDRDNVSKYTSIFIFLTSESVRSEAIKKLFLKESSDGYLYSFPKRRCGFARTIANLNQSVRGQRSRYLELPIADYMDQQEIKGNEEFVDYMDELSRTP